MKINHNITAQLANVNLKKDERRVATSLEKLSSGYKITKAADDSAGMAISNKMRTQIRALNQASNNAEDGQSIVETADGALAEVEKMLQRIRELSVQAANDTYIIDDRDSVQSEIDQLLDEIDRISSTTEFNGTSLLDGSVGRSVTSDIDEVKAMSASMKVDSGTYTIDVTAPPTAATATINNLTSYIPTSGEAVVNINGAPLTITPSDTSETIGNKLVDMCNKLDIDVTGTVTGTITLTTKATGSEREIEISAPDNYSISYGTDAKITAGAGFSNNVKILSNGSIVTIKDSNEFEMLIEVPKDAPLGDVNFKVYDAGFMGMQIGANEHQRLDMNFEEVSCRTLSLRDSEGNNLINVCSQKGADRSIAALDEAIKKVSAVRSDLGAYENRLANTVESLDVSEYNITNAMARIRDTDMADEMTQYTQLTVLQQAATTMLSQANNKPQEIMNLLQGM